MTTDSKTETPQLVATGDLLSLFVWKDVLTDYTAGLVCVLAHDEAEAWNLLAATDHETKAEFIARVRAVLSLNARGQTPGT